MFNIVPLIFIIMSLGAIIIIVARKFAVLANLDINTIQAEREQKTKERIISSRLKRNYFNYYNRTLNFLRPIGEKIGNSLHAMFNKLMEMKEGYTKDDDKTGSLQNSTGVEKIIMEAREQKDKEEWDKAEQKYIEYIGKESGSIEAFRELGEVYYRRKDFHEAKETLEHAIKLLEKKYNEFFFSDTQEIKSENKAEKDAAGLLLAEIYFDLSLVEKAVNNNQGALVIIDKALKMQPNNPRYLDTKFEISIINKDKGKAYEAYEKLKEVNPENQKLDELKGRLSEL
jgi:tetratricopeptide (TPR) repeat protein